MKMELNRFAAKPNTILTNFSDENECFEQDADIVMFTHFIDETNKQNAKIIVAKGRNVKTGEVELKFIPEWTRYE